MGWADGLTASADTNNLGSWADGLTGTVKAEPSWADGLTAPAKQPPSWADGLTQTTAPSKSFGDMLKEEGVPTSFTELRDLLVTNPNSPLRVPAPGEENKPSEMAQLGSPVITVARTQWAIGRANKAEDAARRNPDDANAQKAYEEAKKNFEQTTGRKWLTQEEIDDLPTEKERMDADRSQTNMLANVGSDLKDLITGLPMAVVAGVKGLDEASNRGYNENPDATTLERSLSAINAMGHDTAVEVARLGLETGKSFAGTAAHPTEEAQKSPLTTLANVATMGDVGAALQAGKYAAAAKALSPIPLGRSAETVALAEKLRPTNLARAALTQAVDMAPALQTPAQWLLDANAGVPPEARQAVQDFAQNKAAKTAVALDEAERATRGLNDADKSAMRDVLAGEPTRAVLPDWPDKLKYLQNDTRKLLGTGEFTVDQLKDLADNDPRQLDTLISDFKRRAAPGEEQIQTAESLSHALAQRAVRVIDGATGQDIGGAGFMLFGHAVNPNDIKIEVNPFSPFAEKAQQWVKPMEDLRRIYAEIGNDASSIDVGRNMKLLSKDVLSRNLSYYLPDIYEADKVPGTSTSMFSVFPKGKGAGFIGSKLKNRVEFADRISAGAVEDLDRANQAALRGSINELEKYRLYDRLNQIPGIALSEGEYAKLAPAARSNYTRAPLDTSKVAAGSPLMAYGALAGKYVDKRVVNLGRNVNAFMEDENRVLKTMARVRSGWAQAHVVLNLPSWFDIVISNGIRALADDGLVGAANYPVEIAKAFRRGLGFGKDDEYLRAAKRAGILTHDVFNIKETDGLIKSIQHGGPVNGTWSFLKDRKIEDLVLKPYELAVKDNPIAKRLTDAFTGLDTAARMRAFGTYVKRVAEARGVNPRSLLSDSTVLDAARQHVEQFIPHMNYLDAPLLMARMDRYGIMPFARFGWRTIGAAVDAAVVHPVAFRASTIGGRLAYDHMSEDDKSRVDLQPLWRGGGGIPLTQDTDLNARYMTPYGRPEDLILGGRQGSYGPEMFKDKLDQSVAALGGIPGALEKIHFESKNPLTGKPLNDNGEWFDDNTKSGETLNQFLPGQVYHGKKLVAAVRGEPDARGREIDPMQAAASNVGFRLEDEADAKANRSFVEGFHARVEQLKKQLEEDLRKAPNDDARERAIKRYQSALSDAQERLRELRQPKR